jgi:hypothetical protein
MQHRVVLEFTRHGPDPDGRSPIQKREINWMRQTSPGHVMDQQAPARRACHMPT